jgi:hypothetical protein
MATLVFTIPPAAVSRIQNAFAFLYPIPWTAQILDPDNPEVVLEPARPQYTEEQWTKIQIQQWIQNQVFRAEEQIKIENAKNSLDQTDLGLQLEDE